LAAILILEDENRKLVTFLKYMKGDIQFLIQSVGIR